MTYRATVTSHMQKLSEKKKDVLKIKLVRADKLSRSHSHKKKLTSQRQVTSSVLTGTFSPVCSRWEKQEGNWSCCDRLCSSLRALRLAQVRQPCREADSVRELVESVDHQRKACFV